MCRKVRGLGPSHLGAPVLSERLYRQNIEQLEKVRSEWEQEHRTTCEVSAPPLRPRPWPPHRGRLRAGVPCAAAVTPDSVYSLHCLPSACRPSSCRRLTG